MFCLAFGGIAVFIAITFNSYDNPLPYHTELESLSVFEGIPSTEGPGDIE